jgi:hypothetical protein
MVPQAATALLHGVIHQRVATLIVKWCAVDGPQNGAGTGVITSANEPAQSKRALIVLSGRFI